MAFEGFKVELVDEDRKLRVYGVYDKKGKLIPAVYGTVHARGLTADQLPTVRYPPPQPVEFDLGPIPLAPANPATLRFEVATPEGDESVRAEVELGKAAKRSELATAVAAALAGAGADAAADGETVRVRGWAGADKKPRVAGSGAVRCKDLTAAQLPRVRGLPPAPCVVFDLGPVTVGKAGGLAFEMTTAKAETYTARVRYDGLADRAALAKQVVEVMVAEGFKADRVGDRVRLYGWVDTAARLHPPVRGKVTSAELPADRLPGVRNPPAD